jgi:repressor LexA
MTLPLPETTERIYAFLCRYIADQGVAPSVREIAAACFLNRTSVGEHLLRLELLGRIERRPGKARAIRLLSPPDSR